MNIVVYILAGLSLFMGLGVLVSASKLGFRHLGLTLAAVVFLVAAVVGYMMMTWYPPVIAWLASFLIRWLFGDPTTNRAGVSSALGYSVRKSKMIQRLSKSIAEFDDRYDESLKELFHMCESDPYLNAVLGNHGAGREDLEALYRRLVDVGGGQWRGGHYIPVSAFAYAQSLDYMLRSRNAPEFEDVAYRLILYFERNESGTISD